MFYSQEIRDLFQMKLFVDTDADTRLSRRGACGLYQDQLILSKNHSRSIQSGSREVVNVFCSNLILVFLVLLSFSRPVIPLAVLRDISERGRDLEQVLSQYITFVKPAFEEFCLPVSSWTSIHSLYIIILYIRIIILHYIISCHLVFHETRAFWHSIKRKCVAKYFASGMLLLFCSIRASYFVLRICFTLRRKSMLMWSFQGELIIWVRFKCFVIRFLWKKGDTNTLIWSCF